MKRFIKRSMAAILVVVMLLSAAPLSGFVDSIMFTEASASNELLKSGYWGENINWKLYDNGFLLIEGNGLFDYDFGYEEYWWPSWRGEVKSIKFENGITEIYGDFYIFYNLQSLYIPDTVTKIGGMTFANCKRLTNIDIADSVLEISSGSFKNTGYYNNKANWSDNVLYLDSYLLDTVDAFSGSCFVKDGTKIIAESAFENRATLTDVSIPDSVISIGRSAFRYCDNLSFVEMGENVTLIREETFAGSGVEKIVLPKNLKVVQKSAFEFSKLKSITIPDKVRQIEPMAFYWCEDLESVKMGSFVKEIGEASFARCYNLTKLQLSEGVEVIGEEAFLECSAIDELVLPDSLVSIGAKAFSDCYAIDELVLPDSVVSIGEKSFFNSGIEEVVIAENLNYIGKGAFEGCPLQYVSVDLANKYYSSDSCGVLYNKEKTVLIQYPSENSRKIFEVPDCVEKIDECAFNDCDKLTKIVLGKKVKRVESCAFRDCSALTDIVLNEGVTYIGNEAFEYCTALMNIAIPDSVTTIGENSFSYCESLTNVSLGQSLEIIEKRAFSYCISLEEIAIPDKVVTIGEKAFYCCENLREVTLGESLQIIGEKAFGNCAIQELYIPKSVISMEVDIWGSFPFDGYSLRNITVSDENINYCSDDYGVLFDKSKESLILYPYANERDSYTIPSGVKIIETEAFGNCPFLRKVSIPVSVTTIKEEGLSSWRTEEVYYAGSEEQWKNISIDDYNDNLLNATIHFNSTGGGSGGDADDGDYLYHLYAFSSKPQLIMGTVDAIELTFEIDCYDWENPAYLLTSPTFSFTTSDTNIFSIEKIENRDGRTYVTITGENPGTAFLVVTGYNNGKYVAGGRYMVTVTGESVYHADAIPKFDDYNIIANDIIIDNYKCTNTGTETCNISFDAYNMLNCFGSVELYDSNNNLLESYCIDRFGLGLPTGLWDSVKQAYDVTDLKDLSYKNEDYSTKTKIELIAVPRDGHIVISNDPSASTVCVAYNLSYLVADICCEAVSLAMPSGSADEVSDNIAKAIAKETIETLFGNKAMLKNFESFTKDFLTGANCGSRESIDKNVKYYSVFISEIGVDIGDIAIEIFKESLKELPGDLIETAVYSVLGVKGTIMKTVFKFISFADTKDMIETLSENYGVGNTSIYCSKPWEEQLYSNGYMVTNRELFDENVSFHQYKIVDDDTYDKATNTFGDERYIDIIEMSLYKNGVKQQPQGDVEVAMPLPKGISFMDVEVYRMEDDGSYTEIPCRVEDGYIYITTNHFSVYCIVGEKIEIEDMYFKEEYVQLNLNDSHTNNLVICPGDSVNAELEWSSSDESIAIVTPMGNVVGINPGTVVIYASTKDGKHTASYTLEVVASISMYLNTSNISMNYKSSTTLTPSISVNSGVEYTVEYFSSDPSVATVDENGKVTATGTGNATITVTVTDQYGNVVTDTCGVSINYTWWQWIIVIVLFGWIWY